MNSDKTKSPFRDVKLIILGAGESGIGAALLARQQGYDVFVSDGGAILEKYKKELRNNDIPFEENGHSEEKILASEEIVKSPGIPEKAAIMKKIRANNSKVISEVELAYRFAGGKNIIAITGSNGKSTTTSLIYDMLERAGLDVACVGNIGYSFARQVAINPKENYVLEISSFQLDDIDQFRPHIAILLNITPDHLDRYDYKMENYAASKFRIIRNQTESDYFIYCDDDDEIRKYMNQHTIKSKTLAFSIMNKLNTGAYVGDNYLHIKLNDDEKDEAIASIYDLALKGKHNQYNSMAAGIAGKTMNIRNEKIRESLTTFSNLEHRLEFAGSIRGVEFINDSKATNLNSVWFALESMEKPVILILGGIDKGNDYSIIKELVKEKVKAIICLGLDNKKIHEAFEGIVKMMIDTASAKDAVQAAYSQAEKGDVVLLSPACASFDLFKNYEDRGLQFKAAVKEL